MLKSKPELRFIGFENDWVQQSLDKVTERITRKNKKNGVKVPLTISAQYGLVDQITYFNKQIASTDLSNYYLLQKGDFAYNKSYSKDYPWGAVKRLDKYEEGVLSSLYIVFKPLKVHSDFLVSYYETSRWHKEVSMRATEGARNHGLLNISAADFLKTNLSIPIDFEEQKKIGLFFKKFDDTIALHQQELEALKQTKQGFLQKMFPRDGEVTPEVRFNDFSGDWKIKKINDIAMETFGGGTPKTIEKKFWIGDIPWIQSSDIIKHHVCKVVSKKTISEEAIKSSATKLIPKDSIAVVTRVGVGKLALIEYDYSTSQDFVSLSNLTIDKWFTVYSLYKILQRELHNVQGTSIKGITKNELLEKRILLPSTVEEQVKIGQFFKHLDEVIELKEQELEALKQTKKGFLQKMFV